MNTFIIEIGKYVLPLSKEYKINPELVIAIALTSESCDKNGNPTELFTKCYNAFAARGKYNGNFVDVTINESEKPIPCKIYSSAEESVKDFFNILLTRKIKKKPDLKYANIVGVEDYKKACKLFAQDGYCSWNGEEYEETLIAAIEAFMPNGLEVLLTPPEVKEEISPIKEKNLNNITEPQKVEEIKPSNINDDVEEEVIPKVKNRLRPAFTVHKGKEIEIKNAPIYVSAYDTKEYMRLSGRFFIATGATFNNRVHIVKELGQINAGRKYLLGYVDISDIKK